MRKGITEGQGMKVAFTLDALQKIQKQGYKYVQVKGLTQDKHFDYMEPQMLMLLPMKELPTDPALKDIYEPLDSSLLREWAAETDEHCEIVLLFNNKKAS